MIIVGLMGFPQVGKDTAADALVELMGFEKMSLADPLREMVKVDQTEVSDKTLDGLWVDGYSIEYIVKTFGYERAKGFGLQVVREGGIVNPDKFEGGDQLKGGDVYYPVRARMQKIGEELKRDKGPLHLLDLTIEKARQKRVDRLVMPDVRRIEEAVALKSMGALLVLVDRPGHKQVDESELDSGAAFGHAHVSAGNYTTVRSFKHIVSLTVSSYYWKGFWK